MCVCCIVKLKGSDDVTVLETNSKNYMCQCGHICCFSNTTTTKKEKEEETIDSGISTDFLIFFSSHLVNKEKGNTQKVE